MIKFICLGGINEHGRNAFLFQGERKTVLFDCGSGEHGEDPDFEKTDVSTIDYLFISHSHLDHTGSILSLKQHGFHGRIFLSEATSDAMRQNIGEVTFLKPGQQYKIDNDISVTVTRTGHCFGALAFHLMMEGKKILYTGDYNENSVFSCDLIRDEDADFAIVDGSYPDTVGGYEENKEKFLALMKEQEKVILPLPYNGRSMDVIQMLNEKQISYRLYDDFFHEEEMLYLKKEILLNSDKNSNVILLPDPQIKKKKYRKFIFSHQDYKVILTGNVDEGSYSAFLLKKKKSAFLQIVNVHLMESQAKELIEENHFRKAVIFHNKKTSEITESEF